MRATARCTQFLTTSGEMKMRHRLPMIFIARSNGCGETYVYRVSPSGTFIIRENQRCTCWRSSSRTESAWAMSGAHMNWIRNYWFSLSAARSLLSSFSCIGIVRWLLCDHSKGQSIFWGYLDLPIGHLFCDHICNFYKFGSHKSCICDEQIEFCARMKRLSSQPTGFSSPVLICLTT